MHNDDVVDIISGLIIFLGGLILGAFLVAMVAMVALVRAFVLIRLWAWFIVPTFQLPLLNYPYAIGLSLVIGLFTIGIKTEEGKKIWVYAILGPFLTLFMGWVVKMFI